MNEVSFSEIIGPSVEMGVISLIVAVQLAWYVGVIVLLFKIWQRVKQLPVG